ncbi:hypothetical protein CKF54_05055 [Psittacicella hinzii]|uniref:Carbohydrate kinase PfkB domain-containing protein n=1 Tax=Psittacicella hinzii TaxID=2028575 RepID=A0A3A1Y4Y1_9GAMM|nr:carbohydrate kinase family protein [Psittacicella hinzii]RIY32349.1 hypothetical protein CKF54_05055 [Psittacicella hinzii]
MAIISIGLACQDEFFFVEKIIEEDERTYAHTFFASGGGCAANVAYLTAHWDLETYLVTCLKNDNYGKRISKDLKEAGVNTDFIICNDQQVTPLATVWVSSDTGARTIVTHSNNGPRNLKALDYMRLDGLLNQLNQSDETHIVLVDGYEPELSSYLIKGLDNKIVVMDACVVRPQMTPLLPYVDYAITSSQYAERVTHYKVIPENYPAILRKIKESISPAGVAIVTLGDKGGIYLEGDDPEIKYYSPLKVKQPVDTTGAGDIFHGAFCYGLAQELSLENCCKLASLTAGLAVQRRGVRQAIPSFNEVLSLLQK